MRTIEESIEKLRYAMMHSDSKLLDELTGEQLSYGHTSGLIENRQEFIDAITGVHKRDEFKNIVLAEQAITFSGDVAIVRHRFQAEVVVYGTLMQPDIRVLQIWQEIDGLWRLIARQAYKI